MKRINNKFRGNAVYSLNYKFDSVSSAGKISGTALDLIKRYNELAKEAQSNGNYVEMEVFRQYAEHYRKIVTEINERKNQSREWQDDGQSANENAVEENVAAANNGLVETQAAEPQEKPQENSEQNQVAGTAEPVQKQHRRRGFTVIEVSEAGDTAATEEKPRRRPYRRRNSAEQTAESNGEA